MTALDLAKLRITPEILSLIAEFEGAWRALGRIAPDRLSSLPTSRLVERRAQSGQTSFSSGAAAPEAAARAQDRA
ncbi:MULTISPECIES: hypothetical protein [Rhizobium/Agrobacterium group]|uniref:hypothetical protein n=1 Tax=Rhizobium/Agrobacterium group TaxID=227290 RepID=UPI000847E485|nr:MULTISPECIES: hypothetical protein [Rhizobium/Agrobacterium group]NMV72450.1 hypothetical protein [Agrobacterium fabrum]NTF91374.1 hypothetical protein [Rhizobium rhizogenes]NTI85266.1 hypothetical protein [Rhizobium rhizogenes]NTJ27299.1 hypothetical protein [Rhizobium rhizogenes]QUE84834.1 hypothetical protein EML492_32510 [Rhizobium rhizogenes]